MKLIALHPGPIRSATDGDMHYITVRQLVQLYGLRPDEYVVWRGAGQQYNDYQHLSPQYNKEDYDRIRQEIAEERGR